MGGALLLVATMTGGQPAPDGWKICPNGAQYRVDTACPTIGPHPTYIYFDGNDAALTERARRALDFLAANWHAYHRGGGGAGEPIYLLEAHSDRSEAEADDLPLSRQRATAIRQYLLSKGLPRAAINILLAGVSRPQPAERHGESEADNRRVVIWATLQPR